MQNLIYVKKPALFAGWKSQNQKRQKNTKFRFLEILIKPIQSGVKSVYDSG